MNERHARQNAPLLCLMIVLAGCRPDHRCPDVPTKVEPELQSPLLEDLYLAMAQAKVWGHPYVSDVSMAFLIQGDTLQLSQVVSPLSSYLSELTIPTTISPDDVRRLNLLTRAGSFAWDDGDHVMPIAIVPTSNADMGVLRDLLIDSHTIVTVPIVVAWRFNGVRPAIATIWASRSTEGRIAMGIETEFDIHAQGDHDILIIGPSVALRCAAESDGLGPCETFNGRSDLTRVGLCDFTTWGDALSAMETRIDRVTEVVLFRNCTDFSSLVGPSAEGPQR